VRGGWNGAQNWRLESVAGFCGAEVA